MRSYTSILLLCLLALAVVTAFPSDWNPDMVDWDMDAAESSIRVKRQWGFGGRGYGGRGFHGGYGGRGYGGGRGYYGGRGGGWGGRGWGKK